jgi:hypothetical protein
VAANLSLQDVAEKTRVPLRHLAALEQGDYDSLPGMTYCAGFARAYARVVGMDEAGLVAQMRADIAGMGGLSQSQYEFEEAVDPARVPPRWIAWVAALVALALAGGYGVWRMQLTTPPTDDQAAAQVASEVPPPPRPAAPAPVVPTGPVVMTAADDVWLRIYQPDGTRLYEGTLARGESYTVPANARDPMILTGRPDALAITVGGQAIPPLGTAERTISDVPVSAGALLARPAQPATPEEAGNAAAPAAPGAIPTAPPRPLPTTMTTPGPRVLAPRRPRSRPESGPAPGPAENAALP